MLTSVEKNIANFIADEREYIEKLNTRVKWTESRWNCEGWLFHRGAMKFLQFHEMIPGVKGTPPLPPFFGNFSKAIAVYVQRTRGSGFIAIHKYIIESKRLYNVMRERNDASIERITRWHFEKCVDQLRESGYKNLYDAITSLKVIADIIDRFQLTPVVINFNYDVKIESSRHSFISLKDLSSDEVRKDDEKLPSMEAMKAYALCTNNPIDENEEIIIRTIDLLFALGQRGNEVTLIPYDCLVEEIQKDKQGNVINDAHGKPIKNIGVRFYGEKEFKPSINWLSEQDLPFAFRAIERLKILTFELRNTAIFQERNPGRIWDINPNDIVSDELLMKYLPYSSYFYLHKMLKHNKITPAKIEQGDFKRLYNKNPKSRHRNYNYKHFYKAGHIEAFMKGVVDLNHIQLKQKNSKGWETLLKTSEVLCLTAKGNYAVTRSSANFFYPTRFQITDLNTALGASENMESIFSRRALTESDGSRIKLTSHQMRHWRNTLYELVGMSNVQQALAMGRQRLNQNATYQHTSIIERTASHKTFLGFKSRSEKVSFLQDGIRNKEILGEVTNMYHHLKETKGLELAESFLLTHGNAIHLTPFGGCTHDFSLAPCPKHLQCWNGCSHLHRTNTPGESERLQEQIELGQIALETMIKESDGEYGSNVWIDDLKGKVSNMQKALDLATSQEPVRVFPDGIPVTLPIISRKKSSVSKSDN